MTLFHGLGRALSEHSMRSENQAAVHGRLSLDLSRSFMPETLAGVVPLVALSADRKRLLNQIRAASYLHLFDVFETALATAVRSRPDTGPEAEALGALAHVDTFGHNQLFRDLEEELLVPFPRLARVPHPRDLDAALKQSSALGLVVLALHMKLVTQQHYLACLRGDEGLEPQFVRVLKEHWAIECGVTNRCGSVLALQKVLGATPAENVPSGLADYRRLVFTCDDVVQRQAELDVVTFEQSSDRAFSAHEQAAIASAQKAAHRKTFLTIGIVNAAFVYAMRTLGPTAPAMLAGIVAALSVRGAH
jgi:hypothetical protein